MPYLNLDDEFAAHPKHDALSDGAFRLLTAALCYAAKNLTDGHIPEQVVHRLTPKYRPAHLKELLESDPEKPDLIPAIAGGYIIRDYLDWNRSRDWWETKWANDAKRQAEWRRRHGKGNDDHNTPR